MVKRIKEPYPNIISYTSQHHTITNTIIYTKYHVLFRRQETWIKSRRYHTRGNKKNRGHSYHFILPNMIHDWKNTSYYRYYCPPHPKVNRLNHAYWRFWMKMCMSENVNANKGNSQTNSSWMNSSCNHESNLEIENLVRMLTPLNMLVKMITVYMCVMSTLFDY